MMIHRLTICLTVFFAFGVLATTIKAKDTEPKVTIDKNVVYRTVDGRQLRLAVVRPTQPVGDCLPALVYFHGGSWAYGNYQLGLRYLPPLVASGEYVGFSVEYRFSQHKPFPAQIHDAKAAIRFIRANAEKFGVDPERIGVFGHSAGGHLATLIATSGGVKELEGDADNLGQSSRVTCALNNYGPGDIGALIEAKNTQPRIKKVCEQLIGGPLEKKRDVAVAASPVTYVDKDDPPILIIQGDTDKVVPFEHSAFLHAVIQKAGGCSDLIVVKGHGHGYPFQKEPLALELNKRTKQFFDKHLLGKAIEVSIEPILYTP